MKTKKICVLMVEPDKEPYVAEIGTNLKDLQNAIGGYIEVVPLDREGTVLVCDEEGKLKSLKGNRRVGNGIIAGTFFICGTYEATEGRDFTSLSEHKIHFYSEKFKETENITPEEVQKDVGFTITYY